MADVVGPSLEIDRLIKLLFLLGDDMDRRLLQDFNLSVARFNLLAHLAQDGRLTATDLCQRLLCDKANVARLLEGLEQEGLVAREADPRDGRRQGVTLTEAGKQRWAAADAARLAAVAARFRALPVEQALNLAGQLRLLAESMNQHLAVPSAE